MKFDLQEIIFCKSEFKPKIKTKSSLKILSSFDKRNTIRIRFVLKLMEPLRVWIVPTYISRITPRSPRV
ncbi:hypothetical protein CH378_19945 [Leptospira kmetyi]|uniref:DUF1564 family protein n=1 Tax=Leptospira kmetyi TaxID=408139 RepID=A0ABX4N429_9LEPT|nr:hypothetical protein CH378_19945 [Leptospira kmetyi]